MIRPARDFMFRGKWLVRYDPGEFTYPEILILLTRLQIQLERLGTNFRSLNFTLNKKLKKNTYFRHGEDLFLQDNGKVTELVETGQGSFAPAAMEPLAKPIRSVNLIFPRLDKDQRWKTMGLPAAQLLLASNLQASGFEATPLPLVLPAGNLPPGALLADMAGFTIFEDLLPFLRPFLASFQGIYNGWLAAGGPFPTLAPLAAIFHLSQVNLFVRGEAELALPEILNALNQGDVEALFKQKGLFWQQSGLIVMSDFDRVNRPETFSRFQFNFDFLQAQHLKHGLEMNFSRGCKRSCVFCCRVQGTKFRQLPLEKAEELLKKYKKKVDSLIEASESPRPLSRPPPLAKGVDQTKSEESEIEGLINQTPTNGNPKKSREGYKPSPTIEQKNGRDDSATTLPFFAININDDDILQDLHYAGEIFKRIKKQGFRIFGIQTSIASLVRSDGSPDQDVLDLVADPGLYVERRPLLWLGTDVFLPQRARRLGKRLPSPEVFASLLAEIEKRGLRHFHYWISSDGDSTWEEFIEELAMISNYYRNFPNFGLLAHAPFIVPYPASRSFQRMPVNALNLRIKEVLRAPDPLFNYILPERQETSFPNLNLLLNNEKAGGEAGFFDFLKDKDFASAAQLSYHFLKQEQLQRIVGGSGDLARGLGKLEELIQSLI